MSTPQSYLEYHIDGTHNLRRQQICGNLPHQKMHKFLPGVNSEKFYFSVKFVDEFWSLVGVCGENHLTEKHDTHVYFGTDGDGWGWNSYDSKIYHTSKKTTTVSGGYSSGDTIRIEVDKIEKKFILYKNGEKVGQMGNIAFPRTLFMAVTQPGNDETVGCDYELVDFKDLCGEQSINKNSCHDMILFEERLNRIVEKLESQKETIAFLLRDNKEFRNMVNEKTISLNNNRLISKFNQLKKNHLELKVKHEITSKDHLDLFEDHKILKSDYLLLSKNHENLVREHSDLSEEHEKLKRVYETHIEDHHTMKCKCEGVFFHPEMENNSCVVKQEFEMEIKFSCVGYENQPISDLGNAEILVDEKILKPFNIHPKSLEFRMKFEKKGKHEIKIAFMNIEESFFVNVGSGAISQEKSELVFSSNYKDNISAIKAGEELIVALCFRNCDGTRLPFSSVEDIGALTIRFCPKTKNSKKAVKAEMIELEKDAFYKGILELGEFKINEKFVPGEYDCYVFGMNFNVTKNFVVK